jgi:hypothetical protein
MSRKARAPSLISDAASNQRTSIADRWQALFGTPPPTKTDAFLERAIAWKEQVLAHGDISPTIKSELRVALAQRRSARRAAMGTNGPTPASPLLPPAASQLTVGTRLVKRHGDRNHVVEVTADGFSYEGALFGSLSAVAKHITGTHWNGLLFFGLRKRKFYGTKANG